MCCVVYPVYSVQCTLCAVYSVPCLLCAVYPVCCVQCTLCAVYPLCCGQCTCVLLSFFNSVYRMILDNDTNVGDKDAPHDNKSDK